MPTSLLGAAVKCNPRAFKDVSQMVLKFSGLIMRLLVPVTEKYLE